LDIRERAACSGHHEPYYGGKRTHSVQPMTMVNKDIKC
jgi:hypothetical protein